MYIFHLFRSFRPFENPIGFGASDFVELTLAALLFLFAINWRAWISIQGRKFAEKTGWCMLLLALLPVALRLVLLPRYPIATANVADDFSYLLLADTLAHFRLANPPHPLHQFFETFFVLQQPSYSSVYPLGQGIALALGMLFGHPWAGVAISMAAFCALCYWMLRAWTTSGWALVGGLVAVIQFGPLNQWMNSYWGGAVSACAGCLVFGSLPRLRERGRMRDAACLGAGLGLQVLTRQYESIFLGLSVILFFLPDLRNRKEIWKLARLVPVVLLAISPAIALTLLHNHAVTGSWTTLPNALSRYQYGVPAAFTTQPNPTPHLALTREQELDHEIQSEVHGNGTDTIKSYFDRLIARMRFYRFFFLAPLYLAVPVYLLKLREFRFVWVLFSVLLFSLGSNFYPYFYSHYIAAATCLFVLIAVTALERLSQLNIPGWLAGAAAARVIVFLSFAHFFFWYGLHLVTPAEVTAAMVRYETWDAINQGDPDGRIAVNRQLAQSPGKQLVFVRYWPPHTFKEWVYNSADMDRAQVVWARDLGPAEDEKLIRYYPDRTVWLLEPDFRPPRLTRFPR